MINTSEKGRRKIKTGNFLVDEFCFLRTNLSKSLFLLVFPKVLRENIFKLVKVWKSTLEDLYNNKNSDNLLFYKWLSPNDKLVDFMLFVIPLGFEPKTHSLEGCCSNPTELRNHR